ncbi:unnamed protein product [Ilex paraguariensis]
MEKKIRPYVDQVLMYEDSHRQEAARNTVPVEKLEEKALVALAKEDVKGESKQLKGFTHEGYSKKKKERRLDR